MIPSEFQSKVANAKDLDFGTIFNQSIELFKKSWLQGFLMQLFVIVLMLPFMIILYVPFILAIINQSESGQFDPNSMDGFFAGFSIVYIILFMVGMLVIAAIQMALNAAFFRVLRSLDEGREVKTSDLFYFMKAQYFGKIVLLMLVTILIAIPAALFFYIPFIYVLVPMSFFTIIFAFNPEWSIGDIVGSAFRLGNKKWLLTFGLFVVSYAAIMILTMVTCGLGSLFLAPFMYHPTYFIYKGVVGFEDVSEMNKIGERDFF
ncbi:hypothetical protein [Gelidibacter pelagius]|uniref:Glycerophosphoryl diester phosphodiesterase membrane domain-containing protein n=1 Tax=Gelidibacter pelagius TaxID=2819985 RepID=A0ABS3SXW5_9FLAO|nr:hypothetical protein [Gelidibacter pelagius]MBO3099577.1 hypothetical protein [Gelidibacter pelagius]